MLKTIVLCLVLLSMFIVGCGHNIPTVDEAQYQINAPLAGSSCYIYANTYEIIDGVLQLNQYWAYESGWIFDPTYAYYETPLVLSGFSIAVRER